MPEQKLKGTPHGSWLNPYVPVENSVISQPGMILISHTKDYTMGKEGIIFRKYEN